MCFVFTLIVKSVTYAIRLVRTLVKLVTSSPTSIHRSQSKPPNAKLPTLGCQAPIDPEYTIYFFKRLKQ